MSGEVELSSTGPTYVRIRVPPLTKLVIVGIVTILSVVSFVAISFQYASFKEAALWVEFIKLFLPILGAGFAGYGAAHAAEQKRQRLLAEEKHLHREMVQRTFDALKQLDGNGGTEARIKIKILMTAGIDSKQVSVDDARSVDTFLMVAHAEQDLKLGELRHLVGKTLGQFEDLALAIRYGHIHERLAYDSIFLPVKNFHSWFGAWMAAAKHAQKGAYCEILALAEAWIDGKSLVTGEVLEHQGAAAQKARDAHSAQTSSPHGVAA